MCSVAGVDSYTRQAAVLTAYAESDFDSSAVQKDSRGVYQQRPGPDPLHPWWPTWNGTTAQQCQAFLNDFMGKASQHTGRLVPDCWLSQQWLSPDPRHDMAGFLAAPESINYLRRVPLIDEIIRSRRLP